MCVYKTVFLTLEYYRLTFLADRTKIAVELLAVFAVVSVRLSVCNKCFVAKLLVV